MLTKGIFSIFVLFLSGILIGQTKNPQVVSRSSANDLLTRSLSVNAGGGAIRDISMSGTVRHIAGSTDETGQVNFMAMATGEARIELDLASGTIIEVYSRGSHGLIGEWSGADKKTHPIPYHNLQVDPAWFCPSLILQRMGPNTPGKSLTAPGQTSIRGRVLEHLSSSQQLVNTPGALRPSAQMLAASVAASQLDVYLDPTSLQPVEVDYATHADNNVNQSLPVKILYADYRLVDGVQLPFRIQKFLNGSLILDLQLQEATINTGLAANSFIVSEETSRSLLQ